MSCLLQIIDECDYGINDCNDTEECIYSVGALFIRIHWRWPDLYWLVNLQVWNYFSCLLQILMNVKLVCSSYYTFWSAVAGLQGRHPRACSARGQGLVNCNSTTKRCNN